MSPPTPPRRIDELGALRAVVEGTAGETGRGFFLAVARNLARTLDTHGAWVTEYDEERRRLRALAFWLGQQSIDDFEYDITGTACEQAVDEKRLVHVPDRLIELYRGNPDVKGLAGMVSYLGVPLLGEDERVIGHLGVVDVRPMERDERMLALFQVFAVRALTELRRMRHENELREREEQLAGLVGSAMDGIIELDSELQVTLVNAAAEKAFGCTMERIRGERFARLLTPEAQGRLVTLVRQLDRYPEGQRFEWIAGGLIARRLDGTEFPSEATLTRFEVRRRPYYTLILRNVDERLEAERRIHRLTAQTEYLREEIKSQHNFDEIVGESPAIVGVLRDVERVARTDASVLITGETGTGKELFARAIHNASARRDKPLITVNCAAVPATLIESEFFGHERGAFTGATQRREGRFELADSGTIFLDEIGDLPFDLQGKLLRVLQQGEFEPVGSSRTRRVDVRVLAATNRDLERAVGDGRFREDLYYRLNVFPLRLPPLRERGDDVVLIAEALLRQLAAKIGRVAPPLDGDDRARLRAYSWPGNVRELGNVIERALITSPDGRPCLARVLPAAGAPVAGAPPAMDPSSARVLNLEELQALERENLVRALDASRWRIGGEDGAARRLGTKPSTLRSRMAALGVERPVRGSRGS
jgi:PAS domain S-box-containing protein